MILTARCSFLFDCTDGYYNMPRSTPPLHLLSQASHCSCFFLAFIMYNAIWILKKHWFKKKTNFPPKSRKKRHQTVYPSHAARRTVTVACTFQQSDQCKELFQASLAFCSLQIDPRRFLSQEVDFKGTINTCQSNWTARCGADIESPSSVL